MSEIKDNKKEKSLYFCESELTADSLAESSTYFPKFYLIYVAYGTALSLILSILLSLTVKEKLSTGLILFAIFEISVLIAYRIRLKKMVKTWFKKLQQKNKIDTKHANEFYEEYMIRKSKNRALKLYYNEISKAIETNYNFYIKISGFIITLQKDKCSKELNNFIREKCQGKLINKERTN